MKKVTKKEFEEFITGYPKKLVSDVCGVREPPICSYNDFSGGKIWPESIVAWISMDWLEAKRRN